MKSYDWYLLFINVFFATSHTIRIVMIGLRWSKELDHFYKIIAKALNYNIENKKQMFFI